MTAMLINDDSVPRGKNGGKLLDYVSSFSLHNGIEAALNP
jgi:hypothetical protein